MTSPSIATYTLHNGNPMPVLGLGTYRMKTEEELRMVVRQAISSGYRLIDSATVYKNEEALGRILQEIFEDETMGVKREDLFITSKLSPQHQGYEACYQAVNDSLKRFNLDYFDLYLIHWPGTSKTKLQDPVNQENRMGSYGALEQLYKESKLRQIGVSNYTAKHLQHLLSHCSIRPHVHQFELHPCLYQPEVLSLCRENSIQIQAYSSLGEGRLIQDIEIPALTEIANNLGVTKAQVLLRWAIQHDYAVIPKSKTPERVKSNADLFSFELSDQQLAFLDNVHQTISHRFCWDPTDIY